MRKPSSSTKRLWGWLISLALLIVVGILGYQLYQTSQTPPPAPAPTHQSEPGSNLAIDQLTKLPVKDAETGDDYQRSNFSHGWASWRSCNVRQKILNRDVKDIKLAPNGCTVVSGNLLDPYTGRQIELSTKEAVSKKVQIDHVVALGNAWRTGARYLSATERKQLANDDLELIAVSSAANQEKSDSDADQWLPSNTAFHCAYVARQIAVKLKYRLWVTPAESSAMKRVLTGCPTEPLPAK